MEESSGVRGAADVVEFVSEKKPANGVELAQSINARLDEGVVIAVMPAVIEEITTQEIPFIDKKGEYMHAVFADLGPWGVRMMDVISPNDERIKWWRVKGIAQDRGKDLIPIRWQGPIGEIPQQYFEKDYVLAVRFTQHGPFFFPGEQPKLKTDATLLEAADALAATTPSPD